MKPNLQPRLVNDPLGDPGLYVPFLHEKRALLFDLGDLSGMSAGELLRVSDVFVSHTHIDHFIGFDRLLRIVFGSGKLIRMYGPEGFIKNVEGKLAGFTWNLVDRYDESITLEVTEVHPGKLKQATFKAIDKFKRTDEMEMEWSDGVLLEERDFLVRTSILEHRVPCLGFAIEESLQINIDKKRLEELGMKTGSWLKQLKAAVLEQHSENTRFEVTSLGPEGKKTREYTFAELNKELVVTEPGQKFAYVTDTVFSESNRPRVVKLVQGADVFFCESPFIAEETERARERCHLTSQQAGLLAKEAGVKQLNTFHYSARHAHQTDRLIEEAQSAFRGG